MATTPRRLTTKGLLAEQRFHCHPRSGEPFELVAKFGRPTITPAPAPVHKHAELLVSFEPLVRERRCGGANEFQALCLAIEYLRTTLKAFAADGGRIYWQDSDSPVDLQSPWFGPFPSPGDFGGSWWVAQQE